MSRSGQATIFTISLTLAVTVIVFQRSIACAEKPTNGSVAYSLIRTTDGAPLDIDLVLSNETCGVCHERHWKEMKGSMHSAAYRDPFYQSLAAVARQEAGDAMYAYCSGCHSPAGVVSGLIPATRDVHLSDEAKAGVACDVCHQISSLTGTHGPWGEPGNASFVIEQGLVKFGPTGNVTENRLHQGEKREFFAKSEFCASCHTLIHPINGLRVDDTYNQWKSSDFAKNGVQCQDCHFRGVEEAKQVAESKRPIAIEGRSVTEGALRPVYRHFFVGGNVNAGRLGGDERHGRMAETRLKSALRLELKAPARIHSGDKLTLDLLVHNVGAGHNVPTGVAELRQMWIELRIRDQRGKILFQKGCLDEDGEIPSDAIRFGAIAGDSSGKETYKLWEMTQFLWKRTVPPGKFTRDTVTARLPADLSGTITLEAKLFYRSASPRVVKEIMGQGTFVPKIVEMSTAAAYAVVD